MTWKRLLPSRLPNLKPCWRSTEMPDVSESSEQLSTSQRTLLALHKAVAKLEAVERAKTEPIAIIGVGCRFPGGVDDPDAFWRLLRDGVDAITEVPTDRWDIAAYYDPNP